MEASAVELTTVAWVNDLFVSTGVMQNRRQSP
jgi:hypothetical protein